MGRTLLASSLVAVAMAACSPTARPAEPDAGPPRLLLGADVSEALYAQRHGVQYRDVDGGPGDVLQLLANHGFQSARIRVNVEPPDAPAYAMFTDLASATELATAAQAHGMSVLLDLHYSHWWADPANQWTPLPWRGTDLETLEAQVRRYTRDVLLTLRAAGVEPAAVQLGNEIGHGLLWDLGGPSRPGGSWAALARLVNAGLDGVHDAGSSAKVVLHLESGGDAAATEDWIAHFQAAGGRWAEVDVLGLSYYPMWQGSLDDLSANLAQLERNHPTTSLAIVETAAYWSPNTAGYSGAQVPWPQTPEGQRAFLVALKAVVLAHPHVVSVHYWGATWAQSRLWLSAPAWSNDDASRRALFDDDGVATAGIDGLTR
jgi:arabinogalactan endo-1,4-beta-galactosidase